MSRRRSVAPAASSPRAVRRRGSRPGPRPRRPRRRPRARPSRRRGRSSRARSSTAAATGASGSGKATARPGRRRSSSPCSTSRPRPAASRRCAQVGGFQTEGLAMKGADGRGYTFRKLEKHPERSCRRSGRTASWGHRDRPDRGGPPGGDGDHRHAGAGSGDPVLRLAAGGDAGRSGARRVPRDLRRHVGTFDEYLGPGYQGHHRGRLHLRPLEEVAGGGPENRVDSRAFLKARLFDLVVGNWDRHQGQWRWAHLRTPALWVPLPEDADQAFTRYEGKAMGVARTVVPRFMRYSGEYPKRIEGLTTNNYDVTRWLPAGSSGRSSRRSRASSRAR